MKVKQCDREAAHELIRGMTLGTQLTLRDPKPFYKAFAKHRADELEEAAKVAERWIEPIMATPHENSTYASIASAIRALTGDDDEK